MKALQLTGYGGSGRLRIVDVPQPVAAPGEVLIRVHYAGLNPVDYKDARWLAARDPVVCAAGHDG